MQLHREGDKIRAAGADIVLIGNGEPHYIAGFRKETGYPDPVYTDPSRLSYELAEMKRGILRTVNPMPLFFAVRAMARGQMQTSVKGDKTQQGGVLVVLPGGKVIFHHSDAVPGDLAKVKDIVAALEKHNKAA